MKHYLFFGLLVLLSFLLSSCFRDTITKFEDCVPEVTLVSTESTPTIEIIKGDSGWDDFDLADNDYYVCVTSFSSCGSIAERNFPFTQLPVGTEIKLDGFESSYDFNLV